MSSQQRSTGPAPVDASVEGFGTVLGAAVETAQHAPSIHNTQPWRWTFDGRVLLLHTEPARQLAIADPAGRMLTLSCGAALHHARVAIAAQGHRPVITRFPDRTDPGLLATLGVGDPLPAHGTATRLYGALMRRRTDRRPVDERPPDPQALDEVTAAVETEGVHAQLLRRDQVVELASAAAIARDVDSRDMLRRRELDDWVGRDRPDAAGIPEAAIPTVPGQETVSPRFPLAGQTGTLGTDPTGRDTAAAYLLLFCDTDEPADWLRGGEALSHAWAVATENDLAVLPLSSVVEVAEARLELYRALSGIGHPLIVLRLGVAGPGPTDAPRTERIRREPHTG